MEGNCNNSCMLAKFLTVSKNIEKDSFIWNMTGSMLNAFQSVIMLMVLTRVLGLYEAGLFTIAYANASQFLSIGKYSVRNYQVSDSAEQLSFREYKMARIITCLVMLIVSITYVVIAGKLHDYTIEKMMIIVWMCLFKIIDAYEDVYHGLYQQKDRLDIASKCLTLRMFITLIVYALGLIITKNLLNTLIITTILNAIIFIVFTQATINNFVYSGRIEKKNIFFILKTCFPLFLGSFLAYYTMNAPKYAIDSILDEELQACYGFISMPIFVISLLSNFIFNPMIAKMSFMWNEGDKNTFQRLFLKQLVIIVLIVAVCEVGAYLLGVPVLSWLYDTDLAMYKCELLVLLLGGGFLALSSLLITIITIMRMQKYVMIGYIVVAVIALFLSSVMVRNYSLMGAALLYMTLMILLCVLFAIPLVKELTKAKKVDIIRNKT